MIAENDDDFEVCATEKDYSIKLTASSETIPLLGKMFHEFYDDTLTLQWESVEDASTYLVIVEQCIEENCREVLKQFFNATRFEITNDKFGLCTSYKLQVRQMRYNVIHPLRTFVIMRILLRSSDFCVKCPGKSNF